MRFVGRLHITHNHRTTSPNSVKLAQKSGFVRDPYAILPFDLCDRAFMAILVNPFHIIVLLGEAQCEGSAVTNTGYHQVTIIPLPRCVQYSTCYCP